MHPAQKPCTGPNVAPVNGPAVCSQRRGIYVGLVALFRRQTGQAAFENTAMLGSLDLSNCCRIILQSLLPWHGISEETIRRANVRPDGGCEEAPEVFAAYTTPAARSSTDWHHAIGMRPLPDIDYVQDSSLTVTK